MVAYFYNRKSFVSSKILDADCLDSEKEMLLKSNMVVFAGEIQDKSILLEKLTSFCKKTSCYGTMVNVFSDELYFFPQLKYQDGYLIKNIFADKYQNKEFQVLCGCVSV